MEKILAFAGSNSSQSINHHLLEYIQKHHLPEMEILTIRDWDLPLFGEDLEKRIGSPEDIVKLYDRIQATDKLIIATPEHNGNMTAFLKSTLDWLSRKDRDFLSSTPVFICGTSRGRSGAMGSIENLTKLVNRLGGTVAATFSLPSFGHVFDDERLVDEQAERLEAFTASIKQ